MKDVLSPAGNARTYRQFAHYCHNLTLLFPDITLEESARYYAQTMALQQPKPFDPDEIDTVLISRIQAITSNYQNRSCIWIAFHTGPYPILAHLLHHCDGTPLTILMSAQAYTDYRRVYIDRRLNLQNIDMINVQQPSAIWSIHRALRKGRQLLAFIDGNMGLTANSRNRLSVSFGEHQWQIRTALPHLAHQYGIPLVPLYLVHTPWDALTCFSGCAYCPSGMNRTDFANLSLQSICGDFVKQLPSDTANWKGWLFVHHDVIRSGIEQSYSTKVADLLPYPTTKKHYVMSRISGRLTEVDLSYSQQNSGFVDNLSKIYR
ncbi:lysophospholipid acyltransferase family protein [Sphingobacterium pedocola]|uniref:Lauroyl/myristoyl acyltransferase n=1 Tax=Sphingobacterium pedocola TaxID=2082722 RepID=A0ABR9T760_9SPHI|nr:hypothetical protein [Sphingobacterium pedocola]MBE8721160.1 hypothetical protein [Sphingobacterium pedocola]